MRLPRWFAVMLAFLAGTAGGVYWYLTPPAGLTVATWGDAYGRAQAIALFHPFTDKTGVDVRVKNYGGLKDIEARARSGGPEWDVVDLELDEAAKACREGLLERLDSIELPPGVDGSRAFRDFVPGALGPCWVGSVVYSQVVAYDSQRYEDRPPRTLRDFFDLERFPGPRGLRGNGPRYNLEMALLADGINFWQVYSVLATEGGLQRAFAKLDTIKPVIVWWNSTDEPMKLLASGGVTMTTVLNARVFDIAAQPRYPTIWDGQLYQLDVFGIPKDAARKARAIDFIRFATSPAPLAEEADLLPYGPARHSALRLVGRNPETNEDMRAHLPTAPENFNNALAVDPDWWARHGAEIEARWAEWRAH